MTTISNPLRHPKAIPKQAEHILPLAGDGAAAFLENFNQFIDANYAGNPNLKVLQLREINGIETIAGSNPLVLSIVDRMLNPAFRIATPQEIETTLLEGDPLRIEHNHYVDYGLVLDFSGRNHDLATRLYDSLPQNSRNFQFLPAHIINYDLENSNIGSFGVAPVTREGTIVRPLTGVYSYHKKGQVSFQNGNSRIADSGLPIEPRFGKRKLNVAKQKSHCLDNLGLCGISLTRGLSIQSYVEELANSTPNGRIYIVPQ